MGFELEGIAEGRLLQLQPRSPLFDFETISPRPIATENRKLPS